MVTSAFRHMLAWGQVPGEFWSLGIIVKTEAPKCQLVEPRLGDKLLWRQDGYCMGSWATFDQQEEMIRRRLHSFAGDRPQVFWAPDDADSLFGFALWMIPLYQSREFWDAVYAFSRANTPLLWGGNLDGSNYFSRQANGLNWGRLPDFITPYRANGEPGCGLQGDIWWEWVNPGPTLIIVGARADARPLAQLASRLGFNIVIVDPREALNKPTPRPNSKRPLTIVPEMDPDCLPKDAFWIIMNHRLRWDAMILDGALSTRPRYVGLMGTWARCQEVMARAHVQGAESVIHTPVALDTELENPDEIAISVVADLLAVLHGGKGRRLLNKRSKRASNVTCSTATRNQKRHHEV
ncbi:MAG: hypothetical protein C7B45_08740 [Sulfobacillus acidophilus]|uniref:XdhC Rossmann domain-containing protein n=1 Tax=Sulfobacillus acidophilus TaxID=53633 RepID=A0A2T2WI97_9FIRM|nr:MAG: hypothetical protein C7B45_08740 [Sulfobacillus acidophilus]